jgi:hypothetical protein
MLLTHLAGPLYLQWRKMNFYLILWSADCDEISSRRLPRRHASFNVCHGMIELSAPLGRQRPDEA